MWGTGHFWSLILYLFTACDVITPAHLHRADTSLHPGGEDERNGLRAAEPGQTETDKPVQPWTILLETKKSTTKGKNVGQSPDSSETRADPHQLMARKFPFFRIFLSRQAGMALLFAVGCVFFPLCFTVLCWGLQNHTSLQMERQEAVLVASK
ncbi:hypothetical protein P7K49_023284 [Saguinus oedipus]|uniref:Uncharacterized protein n=1 Tax=Saguinus oedipus TaxID=9490 RepID=A0ABQ9UL80_SAGOE|nr:hypothetical protein P7K49_023284 [Saguinus oedipus]